VVPVTRSETTAKGSLIRQGLGPGDQEIGVPVVALLY